MHSYTDIEQKFKFLLVPIHKSHFKFVYKTVYKTVLILN